MEVTAFQGEHRFLSNFWAEDLLFQGNVYRNMPNRRKLTACVERTKVKLPLPELQPFKEVKWS